MKVRLVFSVVIAVLLLMPPAYAYDMISADDLGEERPELNGAVSDQVLTGMDAITETVSECTDDLLLPPGSTAVLEAVVENETSRPHTDPVTDLIVYNRDEEIDELHISGGAGIFIKSGVTVTVSSMYIESSGKKVSFSTEGTGHIVIKSLVIEGLVMPLPEMTVSADDASIATEYRHNGDAVYFSLIVSYNHDLNVTLGGKSVTYSCKEPARIGVVVSADLTDYKSHVNSPGTFSTMGKLLRYVRSLDLIELDVGILVGGSYGIDDFHSPFAVNDLKLTIKSHKSSNTPGYAISFSLGNIRTYPVDVSDLSISLELPSSRKMSNSESIMDSSSRYELTVGSIAVERTEPDDPLDVKVGDLSIRMLNEQEREISLKIGSMACTETVRNGKGTVDVRTAISGFDMDFKGASSDILDNTSGLVWRILLGNTVEGAVRLGGIEYIRYDVNDSKTTEEASINGFYLDVKVAFSRFNMSSSIDAFRYSSNDKNISCTSMGYDLWASIDASFDPEASGNIRDLLRQLDIRSVLWIVAEGDHDYLFSIDEDLAFMVLFSTEGLRVICGDDTLTFDTESVMGLTLSGDAEMNYTRLTPGEVREKVPGKVRDRLNGGAVIELSNLAGFTDLYGTVGMSLSIDLDEKGAGAYYLDTDNVEMVLIDHTAGDGSFAFQIDEAGLYAVSGPLKEPDMALLACGLLVGAALLGVATVLIGRRLLKEEE